MYEKQNFWLFRRAGGTPGEVEISFADSAPGAFLGSTEKIISYRNLHIG